MYPTGIFSLKIFTFQRSFNHEIFEHIKNYFHDEFIYFFIKKYSLINTNFISFFLMAIKIKKLYTF